MELFRSLGIVVAATLRLAGLASAQPYAEATIHNFVAEPQGASPFATLIQASDGNLYGITTSGGLSPVCGTIFKISSPATSPAYSVIYDCLIGVDGFVGIRQASFAPFASLIQASDGNLYGTTTSGGLSNAGTVFKIRNPATAPVFSVIYSFVGDSDGRYPAASLVQAVDGNLYGTTYLGGSNPEVGNVGTVFKIGNLATSPTESVIYSFGADLNDGVWPAVSLIQGSDGNLYGTTTYGSSNNGTVLSNTGAVFKISDLTTSPTESEIYSFSGRSDGLYPLISLIQATDGSLYGTTTYGGSCIECGAVFKIGDPGTAPDESEIHSFTGDGSSASSYASLIQASDGNLYGTTQLGGSSGAGTVFKISNPATSPAYSVIYNFTGGSDGGLPYACLTQAADGKLYGITQRGGTMEAGVVFSIEGVIPSSPNRGDVKVTPVPSPPIAPIDGRK